MSWAQGELKMSRLSIRPRPLDFNKKLPIVKSVKDFEDDIDTPTNTRNSQILRLAAEATDTEVVSLYWNLVLLVQFCLVLFVVVYVWFLLCLTFAFTSMNKVLPKDKCVFVGLLCC